MSYTSSNQYSPYYQSQTNKYPSPSAVHQSNNSQYQDDSRLNTTYSNGSFQSLSAYQSDYQRQQQQDQSVSSSSNYNRSSPYSASDYNPAPVTSEEQNLPNRYSTSRTDTSALGSLAYASSLGQNSQPSLAQLIDYNRARGSNSYTDNNSYTNGSGHQWTDSGGQVTRGGQYDSQAKSYDNSKQNYGVQAYQRPEPGSNSTGKSSPAQYQYSNPPQAQQSSYPLNTDNNQYPSQIGRAAPAQSMPRPNSRPSYQGNQSPQISNQRAPAYTEQNGLINNLSRAQNQSPAQIQQPSTSTASATNKSLPKPTAYNFARSSKSTSQKPTTAGSTTSSGTAKASASTHKASAARAQSIGHQEQPSPQIDSNAPITVDPTHVFNNYEYQRRQSQFGTSRQETEASARATESAKSGKAKKAQPRNASPVDDVTQAARALMKQSVSTSSDAPTKEMLEGEMKAMIEKMRDYKAQNPGLFSQVWEEVKQGTPNQQQTSNAQASVTKSTPNGASSASPDLIELPAESELETSAFPPGFDRGRYPKERRRRQNAFFTPDEKTKDSHKKKPGPDPVNVVNDDGGLAARAMLDAGASMNGAKEATQEPPALVPPTGYSLPAYSPPSSNQGQPAVGGNTFWPEDKKKALAEAAVISLREIPANSGKKIDATEIHNVLNGNPSYNDLCAYLERRGFLVPRGPFARQLLTAVPDMGPAPTSTDHSSEKLAWARSKSKPPTSTRAPVGFMSLAHLPPSGPYAPPPLSSGQTAYFRTDVKVKSETPAAPMTKEEKARKRNISEIVDLTAFEEEDAFLRKRPKPRIEAHKPAPAKPEATNHDPFRSATDQGLMARWQIPQPVQPAIASQTPVSGPLPQAKPSGNSRERYLYEMVAEPMNKRRDALRRSKYDTRTIARDILLATGRHPTLISLNRHLDPLKERFISVDLNTDLSTFRWDLVDPGGPSGPKPVSVLMKEWRESRKEQGKDGSSKRTDDVALQEATAANSGQHSAPKSSVDRPAKAQNPPVGTPPVPKRRGRPPKYRPSSIQPLGDTQSSPPKDVPSAKPSQVYSSLAERDPLNDEHDFGDGPLTNLNFSTSKAQTPNSAPQAGPSIKFTPISSGPTPTKIPGRRGRPPGAKNRFPRPDKGVKKSRSSGDMASKASTPEVKSETTEVPSGFPPARPSGLRNVSTPTASGRVAVIIPSRSPSIANPASPTGSRRGSNANQVKTETGGTHNPTPFKCQWEGCGAEYPRIESLRRHVRKVHQEDVSREGPWPCKWADCYDPKSRTKPRPESDESSGASESEDDDDDEWERDRLSFAEAERWDRHMERKHIAQYLPGGGLADPADIANSPYMSDASGRRVTPLASPYSGPTDPLPLNTDPLVIAEYHSAHDTETEEEKRAVQVRALKAKKGAVGGAGIYRTGFRSVNRRTRALFAQHGSDEAEGIETLDDGGEEGGLGRGQGGNGKGKRKGKARDEREEEEDEDEDVEMKD